MNKQIKKTVYSVLENDEYARENDNYLILRVAQILEPELAGSTFARLRFSKLSFEGITRARRDVLKKHPEWKTEKMTEIREKEEQEYFMEYGGNHVPRID